MSIHSNEFKSEALEYNKSISSKIAALCAPLLKNFGITHFAYSHFFNNGTYLDFCTDLKWQEHYIDTFSTENFINTYIKQVYESHIKYALWNNNPKVAPEKLFSKFITDSCHFDIWHGFTIYKHHLNSLEAWHFATTKENHCITNFYINNIELLEHFILYFRDRAPDLIEPYTKNLIILKDPSPFIETSGFTLEKNKGFLDDTTVKKYYLNNKNSSISLSRKEAECIFHLSKGRATKEIAILMKVSPRTVETHIENAKRKLGLDRRSQLVATFSEAFNQFLL